MLAYSREIEISRRLHDSFTITWGILGVMLLMLLSNTGYSNIPRNFIKHPYWGKIFLL